jgi:tetratricopeptide (TPR) repeat protein
MVVQPSYWYRSLVLFACVVLAACSPSGSAEQLIALAEHARRDGQLATAADLYHQAAALPPQQFQTYYRAALLYRQVENVIRAEEHLRKALVVKPDSLNLSTFVAA